MKQWTLELDSKWECDKCAGTEKALGWAAAWNGKVQCTVTGVTIATVPQDERLLVSCSRCSYTEKFKPLDGDDDV